MVCIKIPSIEGFRPCNTQFIDTLSWGIIGRFQL